MVLNENHHKLEKHLENIATIIILIDILNAFTIYYDLSSLIYLIRIYKRIHYSVKIIAN
jgi:hypothetical protein